MISKFFASALLYGLFVAVVAGAPTSRPATDSSVADDLKGAIGAKDIEGVRRAIERGADLNPPERRSPLWFAARSGDEAIVELLLKHGARPNTEDCCSPLTRAVNSGNIKIVVMLLKAGAHPNPSGATPLQAAARKGRTDIMRLLIKARADLNAREEDGNTALHYAAYAGKVEAVELLLEAGADRGVRNGFDKRPFDCVSAEEKERKTLLRLLSVGAGAK